ncbi:DUF29 domain-containing protein [Acaryochloris sp. IP29b_bin.148]|uniref:DUF29 domain-containing protein n=1 Tax=Acaryochloris sp. IP29b_bin.148 TaxID=2969218 RepID=UPI0026399119|nr:DUF29 domain-containing protein [Acaryochloris sp. IP29b_bin.148]
MAGTQLPRSQQLGKSGSLKSVKDPHASHQQMYEVDFIQWIETAAELLKRGKFGELDIHNLVEELESLGRSEKNALKSNLSVLLAHLLKWQYQPEKQTLSWISTIDEYRDRIQVSLEASPSLRNYYTDVLEQRYSVARKQAAHQTSLEISTFPETCPFTPEEVLDSDFWPIVDQ